MHIILLKSQ